MYFAQMFVFVFLWAIQSTESGQKTVASSGSQDTEASVCVCVCVSVCVCVRACASAPVSSLSLWVEGVRVEVQHTLDALF